MSLLSAFPAQSRCFRLQHGVPAAHLQLFLLLVEFGDELLLVGHLVLQVPDLVVLGGLVLLRLLDGQLVVLQLLLDAAQLLLQLLLGLVDALTSLLLFSQTVLRLLPGQRGQSQTSEDSDL